MRIIRYDPTSLTCIGSDASRGQRTLTIGDERRSLSRLEPAIRAFWEVALTQQPSRLLDDTLPLARHTSIHIRPHPQHQCPSPLPNLNRHLPRIIIRRLPDLGLHLAHVQNGILGLVIVRLDVVHRDLRGLLREL